jgi:outer membrane protein assembly factor BamA
MYDKTDFRFNPKKGYGFLINTGVGLRRIVANTKIVTLKDSANPEFSFRSLYDSLSANSNQYRITIRAYKYWPLTLHTTLKTQTDLGYIIGNTPVVGELFRLGGNKFLRGFDEESVLVSNYQMCNVEYRVLLDQYSFLSVFTDAAYLKRYSSNQYIQAIHLGLGAGFTFQTKAGIFNMSYALGRTDTAPFNLRSAKIHFGYINIF